VVIVGSVPSAEPPSRRCGWPCGNRPASARWWQALDALLALVVGVDAVVQVARGLPRAPAGPGWDLLRYLAIGAACAALAGRRRYPQAAALVASAGVGVGLALHSGSWLVQVAVLAVYSMAAVTPWPRSPAWLAGGLLALLAGAFVGADRQVSEAFGTGPLLLVVGWTVGEITRSHRVWARALARELADRAARADAEREERLLRAALEERIRIARELHDTLAHAMSIITVRSGVARVLLDSRPEEARDALGIIEETGRDVMRQLRLLLGVLRAAQPGSEPSEQSEPAGRPRGLTDLAGLLDRVGAAGVRGHLVVEGVPRPLPDGVERAGYGIAQEALTNVVRHAGPSARARLRVSYQPQALHLEVTNSGPEQAGGVVEGHGLAGMRERAELLGGEFAAGPLPGGGFRVLAVFPAGFLPGLPGAGPPGGGTS
jgi:signal transduction histidine kinase